MKKNTLDIEGHDQKARYEGNRGGEIDIQHQCLNSFPSDGLSGYCRRGWETRYEPPGMSGDYFVFRDRVSFYDNQGWVFVEFSYRPELFAPGDGRDRPGADYRANNCEVECRRGGKYLGDEDCGPGNNLSTEGAMNLRSQAVV